MISLKFIFFFSQILFLVTCYGIHIEKDGVAFKLVKEEDSLKLYIYSDGKHLSPVLKGTIRGGFDLNNVTECGNTCLQFGKNKLEVQSSESHIFSIIRTMEMPQEYVECFDLDTAAGTHWWGGPERFNQYWPLEKLVLNNFSSVPQESEASAIAEPYWLNSKGAGILYDIKTPLFINQNDMVDDAVCFISKLEEPYLGRTQYTAISYVIVNEKNPRETHLEFINKYLGKPTGFPDLKMIERPIWSTWARYKKNINDKVCLEFADEIIAQGFEDGQFELDDDWEVCYGSREFKLDAFGDINNTVKKLKEKNFRVTLWIHPFVDVDCFEYVGISEDFLVKNYQGSNLTSWWNAGPNETHYLDFTKAEVRDWFSKTLKRLQDNHGIDSFKFDAGECSFAPQVPVLQGDIYTAPMSLTQDYVRTCATFGNLIEVRTGYNTQDLPVFVRMLDKDSRWGTNNGLYTLITTLLQMNMNGYTMVLPDMIGGNGYGEKPSAELFVRWLQANTFMPSIQFSFVPWDFSSSDVNVLDISLKFVDMHKGIADIIVDAMEASIKLGHPVNGPLWFIDQTWEEAQACDTQFLLGEDIVIAPVIEEGATKRDILLPLGRWIDGNTGEVIDGRAKLVEYPAPIDVLPYFLRLGSNAHKRFVKLL